MNKCRELFELGTKSPWTTVFMTLDLCMEHVSAVQPFMQLAVNQVRLCEWGESDWCGCLYKGTEDSRGGNSNDRYGQ